MISSIYPPLLRFAEEESEAKLNKVILVSWKSYSQSLPLLLSQTNSSIEAFPIQTGAPHTKHIVQKEIQKYFNRNTKICKQKYQNTLTTNTQFYYSTYLKCKYESGSYLILDKEMSIEWSVSDFEHNACL